MGTNCGRSWESADGVKTITGRVNIEGVDRYLVHVPSLKITEYWPVEELESRIGVDQSWAAHAKIQRAVRQDAARREAKAKAEAEDTSGFADQFSPLKRGRVIACLNREVRYKGRRMTRKALVRLKVQEGWIVGKGCIEGPDGIFLDAKHIGGSFGIQYMEWMQRP